MLQIFNMGPDDELIADEPGGAHTEAALAADDASELG